MKHLAVILLSLALTLVTAAHVKATSGAHFFKASPSLTNSGALAVALDEAGVGQQTVNLLLNALQSATFACINGGGHNPSAANKQVVTNAVSAGGAFIPQNGRITGTITTPAPSVSNFCPPGQSFVLACVSYTNISLSDLTNNVTTSVGDVSKTYYSGVC